MSLKVSFTSQFGLKPPVCHKFSVKFLPVWTFVFLLEQIELYEPAHTKHVVRILEMKQDWKSALTKEAL